MEDKFEDTKMYYVKSKSEMFKWFKLSIWSVHINWSWINPESWNYEILLYFV